MDWSYGTSTWASAEDKPRDNYVELDSGVLGIDGIAIAVAQTGSGGVCIDEEAVQRDAADFADAARRAVQNGQTIEQVMCNAASLSAAAKAEIYEQACIQQGTTSDAVAAKAEQECEQTREFLQQGIMSMAGLLGASAAQAQQTGLGLGVTGGDNVSLAMLGDLVPLQTPGQQREREMGLFA